MRFSYEEHQLYDIITQDVYTIRKVFDFRCQMMYWANDRIRIQFYGAFMGQPLLGKILDSRDPVPLESEFDIKDNPDLNTTDLITFNHSIAMSQGFYMNFHDDLKNMKAMSALIYCDQAWNKSAYNSWNMSII